MTTPLRQLLAQYRAASRSEREKGTYFERLAVAFIKHDPGMVQEYEDAWLFPIGRRRTGWTGATSALMRSPKSAARTVFARSSANSTRKGIAFRKAISTAS